MRRVEEKRKSKEGEEGKSSPSRERRKRGHQSKKVGEWSGVEAWIRESREVIVA